MRALTLSEARRLLIAAAIALGVLLVAASVLAATNHSRVRGDAEVAAPLAVGTELQTVKTVPNIPLTNAAGRPVSLRSLRGRWVVFAPSMTLCQEVCPMTTGALNELEADLRVDHLTGRVAIVEATVDPWRDRPARLRAYAKLAGIHFQQLTGTLANVKALWKFFHVYYHQVAEGRPAEIDWLTHRPLTFDVEHTDGFFIIDPAGHLRIADEGMPALSAPLSRSLRALLDADGRKNLAHPELPWTAPEIIEDLNYLMDREMPASQLAVVHAPSLSSAEQQLKGSPTTLAAIHKQADRLLGGPTALLRRIASLRGHPIVINLWASWCPPCRSEFPLLAAASAQYGRDVAFLGVDVNDTASAARAFLDKHEVSYPSYVSTYGGLNALAHTQYTPQTIYISPGGKIEERHLGEYDTAAALENDIQHYALGVHG